MSTKHTPGPWRMRSPQDYAPHLRGRVIRVDLIAPVQILNDEPQENACRIVACVNACEGIADPSVVPDLIELLKEATCLLEKGCNLTPRGGFLMDARSILARTEKRKPA